MSRLDTSSSIYDTIFNMEGDDKYKEVQCEIELKRLKKKLEELKDEIKNIQKLKEHYKYCHT